MSEAQGHRVYAHVTGRGPERDGMGSARRNADGPRASWLRWREEHPLVAYAGPTADATVRNAAYTRHAAVAADRAQLRKTVVDSISHSEASEPGANAWSHFVIAVTAAIIGALVPDLFGTATATARLGGMMAAAVLPLILTWAGPWQPLRASMGVALAAGAIALTYLGGAAVDSDAFPIPDAIAHSPAPNAGHGQETSTGKPVETEKSSVYTEKSSIDVNRTEVDCSSDGTCDKVTVTNLGPQQLSVSSVKVDEREVQDFIPEHDCDQPLQPRGQCTITVTFAPSDPDGQPREATLLIAHDGQNSPRSVRLSAVAPPRRLEGNVAVVPDTDANCTYTDTGHLIVPFDLSATGDHPDAVTITGTIGDHTTATRAFPLPSEEPTTLTFPEEDSSEPGVAPGETSVAIELHLADALTDADASDDRLTLQIDIPYAPQSFDCSTL